MDLFDYRSATISEDGAYRYDLRRRWAVSGPTATFVMLNPSTADGSIDDATIRRCTYFAKREGCASLLVVNLCALRATKPAALLTAADPCGPHNRLAVADALEAAHAEQEAGFVAPVIVAWGAFPIGRVAATALDVVLSSGCQLQAFGTSAAGAPLHPLYQPNDRPLQDWTMP